MTPEKATKAMYAIQDLLTAIYGEYWRVDPNFEGTPARVVKSYQEILKYEDHHEKREAIKKCFSKIFPSKHESIIFAPNITTHSMCPHHLLPVTYNMTIAYIPKKNGDVVGASKLERVARILSARAVLQEDLTNDIAQAISEYLTPLGIAVVTSGVHDCMRVRGIKTKGTFEVSTMRGAFKDNEETRAEFFSLMSLALRRR